MKEKGVLCFIQATEYEPGIIFSLLSQSFSEILNSEFEKKLRESDREIFENPDTVGACVFITTCNGEVIGMASYDPREGPEVGKIGYNCVLPKFQGQGFGRKQICEILKRFKARGFKRAVVITGNHPFFLPAQKMYKSCGFKIESNDNSMYKYTDRIVMSCDLTVI